MSVKVTVPAPYQMVIKEQKKKQENMTSKSDMQMVHKLLRKKEYCMSKTNIMLNIHVSGHLL